jgi:hypothetical protein
MIQAEAIADRPARRWAVLAGSALLRDAADGTR